MNLDNPPVRLRQYIPASMARLVLRQPGSHARHLASGIHTYVNYTVGGVYQPVGATVALNYLSTFVKITDDKEPGESYGIWLDDYNQLMRHGPPWGT